MEAISLLIPVALLLLVVIIAIFLWAVRSGQYDDMEGPAYQILMDDDEVDLRKEVVNKVQQSTQTLNKKNNHPDHNKPPGK